IWVTPVLANQPTQPDSTTPYGIGGAYHGYWILDYENADPHLGTNAELQAFIDAAHTRGIKVFFDIVVNHTADVIAYAEGSSNYISKADEPYRDASGDPFDDRDYAGSGSFPPLDAATSFPYTPIFPDPADATAKNPAWLNDPIYYHNRGNSTFLGESSQYGDFYGLDDLFTEQPDVVNGYVDIFKGLIDNYNIDGFRLDTVKHVNDEFWQGLAPKVMAYAQDLGKDDFFMFGEVFDGDPAYMSHYTTVGQLPSVLDFALHGQGTGFAVYGNATDSLRDLFASDDYYTDADSNAYALGNFISNHDLGRLGYQLRAAYPGASEAELVDRMELGYGLLYFARGFPVIYYGDEQGFVGGGSDKLSREDMMPSLVPDYKDNDLIGTAATPAEANFDTGHPLYQALADYAGLYQDHLALRRGAQIHRYSEGSAGIYAFSRIERNEKVEYVLAFNNAASPKSAVLTTFTPATTFSAVYPAGNPALTTDGDGQMTVDVPALGFVIYRADAPLPASDAAPTPTFTLPAAGAEVFGQFEAAVSLSEDSFTEVTFAVKVNDGDYEILGTDTNAPYRVFYDPSDLSVGTALTFRAITNDLFGHLDSATVSVVVGAEEPPTTGPTYAVIHYYRDDGDYGDHTTGDYNDYWGLHLWGDIDETIEWTSPKPFLGEDEYGRFAWVKLAPTASNVGFIVHRGDTKDGTTADRFFNPGVTPEIWLRQDEPATYTSQAEAQGYVTIRYHRDDDDYGTPSADYNTFWGLHLWGDAIADGVGTDWASPRPFDGIDDYGAYWNVPIKAVDVPVNFIIHRGDAKDPGPDQSMIPFEDATIWIQSGDETIYPSRGAAENTVVLRYHRADGDYGDYASTDFNDFWGMHVWTGAANPNPSWQEPVRPVGFDIFGPIFNVPLADGATQLAYILHRGDTKDPGPDQFLTLDEWGYEVWQLEGEGPDAEKPHYVLPILAAGGANPGNINQQQAYWVSEDTIAWAAADSSANSYTLHYAPAGGLEATDAGITGGSFLELTPDPAGLPQAVKDKFPHLADLPALKIAAGDLALVPEILKGQIAVSAVSDEGLSVDATGLQIPGVLDDLYTYDGPLGIVWDGETPALKVWAPTAKSVAFHLFDDADPTTTSTTMVMDLDPATGVWTIQGDASWKGKYYLYEVEVYVHSTDQVEHNLVTDPYSLSLAMNSRRSQIVDLADVALAPAGWDSLEKPPLAAPEDISIYEIHVRDFSVNDPSVPDELKGTFKAFTLEDSNGMRHLEALADAGLTHLHLLPVFDIATINE
ncbi:MAG: alpha-amylase family glycosyl hydrolase, partial [Chloroflexota bacterium]